MSEPIKLPPMPDPWNFTRPTVEGYARLAVEQNTADLRAEVERLRVDAERFRSVVQSVAVTELHKVLSGDRCVCTRCELARGCTAKAVTGSFLSPTAPTSTPPPAVPSPVLRLKLERA
jgi:hypothetical protein